MLWPQPAQWPRCCLYACAPLLSVHALNKRDVPSHSSPSKVVVFDDQLSMRRWLRSVIDKDPRLHVVGTAATAQEARRVIRETNPDVLTLDLDMPEMNGLEFLEHVMRLRPMPVVMLSGQVEKGDDVSRQAHRLGAAACIPKPVLPSPAALSVLCDQIVLAAVKHLHSDIGDSAVIDSGKIILVGGSTGGVTAIESFLKQIPARSHPIVIAQHMPHDFLTKFAKRLDTLVDLNVDLAKSNMELHAGDVAIAPAGYTQTQVAWSQDKWRIVHTSRRPDDAHCPRVDTLFLSAVPWARQVGAVLLSGIGSDGADGMLALRNHGARTLGQSQSSCAVYGMPAAAHECGAVERECGIESVGSSILNMMAKSGREMQ